MRWWQAYHVPNLQHGQTPVPTTTTHLNDLVVTISYVRCEQSSGGVARGD